MEKTIFQKGPKFAITPTSTSKINYITTLKHICASLGENNLFQKKDMEYYAKVKDVLTKFTNEPKSTVSNITKQKRKAQNNLKKDDNHIGHTDNKEVTLVVVDKDMPIEKCMALLNDQEVHQECKDQTKSIHVKYSTS